MQVPKLLPTAVKGVFGGQPKIISPLAESSNRVLGAESVVNTDIPLVLLVGAILAGITAAALITRHLPKKRKRQTPVTTLAKE